ncbi:TetR/AcrR family transcriptional regulator [Chloroflexi bacterium TSY]|nr:TetR/AcrR family transcriptional regulator [Chloroflexi bacterium TSY]
MNRHASAKNQDSLTRNERRRLRTRQRLLNSTAALLVELGYDTLTVQDITDDADVARATFYIHFQDKEEAVWAVLEEHLSQLVQLLAKLDESEPNLLRYQKFIGIFKFVESNRQLMNVLLSEKSHIKLVQRLIRFMADSLQLYFLVKA